MDSSRANLLALTALFAGFTPPDFVLSELVPPPIRCWFYFFDRWLKSHLESGARFRSAFIDNSSHHLTSAFVGV